MSKTIAALDRIVGQKGLNNRLRREGRIPAVVYGHEKNIHISINAHDFAVRFKRINESEIITLELGKNKHQVLIKDYQKDVLRNEVIHLDFLELTKDHALKTHVAVKVGAVNPAIAKAGGLLEVTLHELEIECLPGALPEVIEVDISELAVGHAIHVRDIKAPKGVKILNRPDQVVVAVTHAKAEIAAQAAQTAEPAAAASPAAKAPEAKK